MESESSFFERVLENLSDGVYYVDKSRVITYWNKAAERITGYRREEVVGKSCSDDILRHIDHDGKDLCLEGCPLSAIMQDRKSREVDVFLHHKEGHRVPVTVRGTPLLGDNDEVTGAIEIFSDNSARESLLEEMEKLKQTVLIDPLTKMGNRRLAEMTFKNRVRDFVSYKVSFSILLIDVDYFKKFNDTYGHNLGDEVLKMVAKTISNIVRKIDTVVRWGGEEFLIIIPNIDQENLKMLAERVRIFIEKSWIKHEEELLKVTVSIGGASLHSEESIEELIKRADERMYQCKKSGRNCASIGE